MADTAKNNGRCQAVSSKKHRLNFVVYQFIPYNNVSIHHKQNDTKSDIQMFSILLW